MASGKPSVPPPISPAALKAYAHPLRLEIIRYLNDHGQATSATLARALGESTGQTSYHLRQLARHGLVVEDEARGTARERWWTSASIHVDAATMQDEPGLRPAAQLLLSSVVRFRTEALQRWLTRAEDEDAGEWRLAATHNEITLSLTPDELQAMSEAVQAATEPFQQLSRDRRDSGRAGEYPRIRAYYDAFPLLDHPAAGAPVDEDAAIEEAGPPTG